MHVHCCRRSAVAIIENVGTLTERYQTTIPASVRRALHLMKHDKIVFKVIDENTVILERQSNPEEDPALGRFLDFLASDIAAGTASIRPVTHELVDRIGALTNGTAIDLDQPLPSDDEDA
ncbi:MAG: type II toxin-antitoxin system PrlF family antitoxin [Rhodospirillaceae bacterium]|nr:type II toxin-antitoxin system PrlF family antitoxin [Rhodospirillaceae bacterium]